MTKRRKKTRRRSAADMEASKPWWQSVTVWGGIISIVAPAIGAITHFTFDVQTTNEIAVYMVGIATGIGGLISIYGRIRTGQNPSSITMTRQ